jgi:hypothetical protein
MGTDCMTNPGYIAPVGGGGEPTQGIVQHPYEDVWDLIGLDPVHYSVVCVDPDNGNIEPVNAGGACPSGFEPILNQREYYRSKLSWCGSEIGGIGTILCDKLDDLCDKIGDGPPLDEQHDIICKKIIDHDAKVIGAINQIENTYITINKDLFTIENAIKNSKKCCCNEVAKVEECLGEDKRGISCQLKLDKCGRQCLRNS